MKALIATLALLAAGPALAQTTPGSPPSAPPTIAPAPAPPPSYGPPIGIAHARAMIDHAITHATARGFRLAIAIVEPSGELVAFARMDDTQYGSLQLARLKAETSARYRRATSSTERALSQGVMAMLAIPDTLPMAGGVPIIIDGKIVGAMGISGAASSDDEAGAVAAINAVLAR